MPHMSHVHESYSNIFIILVSIRFLVNQIAVYLNYSLNLDLNGNDFDSVSRWAIGVRPLI